MINIFAGRVRTTEHLGNIDNEMTGYINGRELYFFFRARFLRSKFTGVSVTSYTRALYYLFYNRISLNLYRRFVAGRGFACNNKTRREQVGIHIRLPILVLFTVG